MHTSAEERPLWQKVVLALLAATLVVGLSPAPLPATQAFADEGGSQLAATSLAGNATVSTSADEATQEIAVTNLVKMFVPAETSILKSNGETGTLEFAYTKDSFESAFVGPKKDAKAAKEGIIPCVPSGNGWTFSIPVTKLDGTPFVTSFYSKAKKDWYERWMVLDAKAGTLFITSGDPSEAIAKAAKVDDLIAAIQVQERTSKTDAQCTEARNAWDDLDEIGKAFVKEYDYFGLDTGDASKDKPLNGNKIGKKEILVVSFGTSFNDSRVATIGGVEKAIQKAYPSWSVRRAFTAQIIINHIQARDGVKIDNMDQALKRAVKNGVKQLVVAPTHLMHGAEYDELVKALKSYKSKMKISISEPLLGAKSTSKTKVNADKAAVAKAVVAAGAKDAGYKTQKAMAKDKAALVLMGHGTSHEANVTYLQMQKQMDKLGYKNVFVGTVEGEPEGTECSAIIEKVKAAGYTKVYLRPLMVVAGDHANNDMADPADPESWISQFTASGAFSSIECQLKGLGQIKAIQKLYVKHVGNVVLKANKLTVKAAAPAQTVASGKTTKLAAKNVFNVVKNTGKGKVTYELKSVPKAAKGKIAVAKNGKVTVKKGLKKGTYRVKVTATSAQTKAYRETSKTVAFKVTVK